MKPFVKIVVNVLALVGAHEIYKEYTSRKNSEPVVGSLDNETVTVFDAPGR